MSADKREKKYPHRPDVKGRPKSSQKSGGKGKPRFELNTGSPPERKAKLPDYTLTPGGVTPGHSNPSLMRFLAQNRHNRVPIRQWGGKSKVDC